MSAVKRIGLPMMAAIMVFSMSATYSIAGDLSVHTDKRVLTHPTEAIAAFEPHHAAYRGVTIADRVVYYRQRMIGDAMVIGDLHAYHLDKDSMSLLNEVRRWRDDLPETLPEVVSQAFAESMVDGHIVSSQLAYLPQGPSIFNLDPVPCHPCWIIRTTWTGEDITIHIIDGVTGAFLGYADPPPSAGFAMSGNMSSCTSYWSSQLNSAAYWFEEMGYSTDAIVHPEEREIRDHVRSHETAVLFEIAHGDSYHFRNSCTDMTYADEVAAWMVDFEKMPFAFIASCLGMYYEGEDTFSYALRNGEEVGTAVVGYCGMSQSQCEDTCWPVSTPWQNEFFSALNEGETVGEALQQALIAYPMCVPGEPHRPCMVMEGDPDVTLVPNLIREAPQPLSFVEMPTTIPAVHGAVAWGDFDNDNDLDLIATGEDVGGRAVSTIYRNDRGTFVDIRAGLTALTQSAPAWGDYDHDGDLDLAITGRNNNGQDITLIYRNDGDETFVDIGVALQGVSKDPSLAWGDYDNDTDLDLAVSGGYWSLLGQMQDMTVIYRNDGGDTFVDAQVGLPGLIGAIAWGDYNTDGYLDLVSVGKTALGNTPASNVYQGDGNGGFVDIQAGLPGVYMQPSVAWGDYDNDGDLDLALCGCTGHGDLSEIYRNDNGVFTEAVSALARVHTGTVAWGDFDNDGDLDLLLHGRLTSGTPFATIYENVNGAFMDMGVGLDGVSGHAAIGDYNDDGHLDLALVGHDGAQYVTKIYRKYGGPFNTAPTPPTDLDSSINGDLVTFSFSPGSDEQTPAAGLTYNLRIGSEPGLDDVFSSASDHVNGLRRLPQSGNTGHRLSWTFQLPDPDVLAYYWSVQSIDASFTPSHWADERHTILVSACCVPETGECEPNREEEDCAADYGAGHWFYATTCDDPSVCTPYADVCRNGFNGFSIEVPCRQTLRDLYTGGANNTYDPAGITCADGSVPGAAPGPDVVYRVTTEIDTDVTISAINLSAAFDATLYVVTSCSDWQNTCLTGVNENGLGQDETVSFTAEARVNYYIIVDGAVEDMTGTFDLQNQCSPHGTCCSLNGDCTMTAQETCTEFWQNERSCAPNPCPMRGACCLPDGTCEEVTATACADACGLYQGDGVACEGDPIQPGPGLGGSRTAREMCVPFPQGACCLPDETCVVTHECDCTALGGTYLGVWAEDCPLDGTCPEQCGGYAGIPCLTGEYCKYVDGTCDLVDDFGACRLIPADCPTTKVPVCGCNGITYKNECLAEQAEVSIDHDGACSQ